MGFETPYPGGSSSGGSLGAGSVGSNEIADGSIVDADISATAAIKQSKLSLLAPSYLGVPGAFATDPFGGSSFVAWVANQIRTRRIVMPKSGTLSDLVICVGTSSGNFLGGVYDTGNANGADHTVRTRLDSLASVASAAGWLSLGNPNLAVSAGDVLDFAVNCDNATATVLQTNFAAALPAALPSGYYPVSGAGTASGKLHAAIAQGAFTLSATYTDAAWTLGQRMPLFLFKIT